jgi:hypothetical protein
MTTSASANTALTSASYHVDAGQKIVSGEDLAQVVPQQHASRRRRGSLRCQRSPLQHHAFVGIRQGAMNVLLDDDHGHTRLPGVLETIEHQVDICGASPRGISSAMRSFGDVAKARASESICCPPPEFRPVF